MRIFAQARVAADQLAIILARALDNAPPNKVNIAVARQNVASLLGDDTITQAMTSESNFTSWASGFRDVAGAVASTGGPDVRGDVDRALASIGTDEAPGFPTWLKYAIVLAVVGAGVGGTIWYLRKTGGLKHPALPPWKMAHVSRGGRRPKRMRSRGAVKMRRRSTGIWEPEDDLEGLDGGELEGST